MKKPLPMQRPAMPNTEKWRKAVDAVRQMPQPSVPHDTELKGPVSISFDRTAKQTRKGSLFWAESFRIRIFPARQTAACSISMAACLLGASTRTKETDAGFHWTGGRSARADQPPHQGDKPPSGTLRAHRPIQRNRQRKTHPFSSACLSAWIWRLLSRGGKPCGRTYRRS